MEKKKNQHRSKAKFGNARPKRVRTPTARSEICPRRWAASMPAGIAMAAQTISARTRVEEWRDNAPKMMRRTGA